MIGEVEQLGWFLGDVSRQNKLAVRDGSIHISW